MADSKLGAPAIAEEEEEDVCEVRDTCAYSLAPSAPRAPKAKRRGSKAADPRRRSIAPHALGASWWV